MNDETKLISWLRDAHALEKHTETALQKYAKEAREYPSLNAQLLGHLEATRGHAQRLETCLDSLGRSHSGFESAVAKILGAAQAAASTLLGDAVLTDTTAVYALEHLAVATYTAIVAAAEKAGRQEIAQACREIMADDAAIASWLLEHLPDLTRDYLNRN